MKNIKNTVAAFTLLAVMAFGTTFANAGIIILGASSKEEPTTCSDDKGIMDDAKTILEGIIILGKTGIIILGAGSSDCNSGPSKDGIIIL